jgi:hypothetical protein
MTLPHPRTVDNPRKRKNRIPFHSPLSLSPLCPYPPGECPKAPLDHLGTEHVRGMTFCDPPCQDFVIYPRRKLGSGDGRSEPVVASLSVNTAPPPSPHDYSPSARTSSSCTRLRSHSDALPCWTLVGILRPHVPSASAERPC